MRFFSFKILAACILLPPVLYLLTVLVLERQIEDHFAQQVAQIYMGDPQKLLDGSVRLEEALATNINQYLAASFFVRHGFAVRVSVATRSGKLIYPSPLEPSETAHADPSRVAVENFALLSEGLTVRIETHLEHNRLISNAILGAYILAALSVLLLHYRSAGRQMSREEHERRHEFDQLVQREKESAVRLFELQSERERLREEFERLKIAMERERSQAEQNEDDLITEIETLEKKLAENLGHQDSQQAEIQSFKEKIALLEKEQRREEKGRSKASVAFQKRFATLYKNIAVNERAVDGFVDLNEEMRLKAEEVIHQLNANPDLITIKRKVFGKKNRETVLEVVFAYKGRLYFRKGADRRVEIVAIGTKNSQERELEFLAGL